MPRKVAVVETLDWDGTTWRRYPEAKQRNHRVYFQAYRGNVLTNLHRAVWEKANGPIPSGHEIHHADGDPLNNDLGNLECLTVGEHRRREAEMGSFSTSRVHANLDRIRHLASAWHRTEEGRQWHRENCKQAMANRPLVEKVCIQCKTAFRSKQSFAVCCSRRCTTIVQNNKPGNHHLMCRKCSQPFLSKISKQLYCSRICSGKTKLIAAP